MLITNNIPLRATAAHKTPGVFNLINLQNNEATEFNKLLCFEAVLHKVRDCEINLSVKCPLRLLKFCGSFLWLILVAHSSLEQMLN